MLIGGIIALVLAGVALIVWRVQHGGLQAMSKVEIGTGLLANVAEAFMQNDRTIGIERKEWGIAPGQRLYVLAEASDRSGRLAMMKPAEGKFMISTRTEEELRSSEQRFVNVARITAAVLGAIGVVLVVLGLIL
jgi:hypothetical protein